jgi:hypothetical protein
MPAKSVTKRERPAPPRLSLRADVALARDYLKAGGVQEVARRAAGRVRRVVGGAPPEATD